MYVCIAFIWQGAKGRMYVMKSCVLTCAFIRTPKIKLSARAGDRRQTGGAHCAPGWVWHATPVVAGCGVRVAGCGLRPGGMDAWLIYIWALGRGVWMQAFSGADLHKCMLLRAYGCRVRARLCTVRVRGAAQRRGHVGRVLLTVVGCIVPCVSIHSAYVAYLAAWARAPLRRRVLPASSAYHPIWACACVRARAYSKSIRALPPAALNKVQRSKAPAPPPKWACART